MIRDFEFLGAMLIIVFRLSLTNNQQPATAGTEGASVVVTVAVWGGWGGAVDTPLLGRCHLYTLLKSPQHSYGDQGGCLLWPGSEAIGTPTHLPNFCSKTYSVFKKFRGWGQSKD